MRIVHVLPYALDRRGGVQTHVGDLCAWLDASGHETRIVAPPGRDATERRLHAIGRSRLISLHGTRFEVTWADGRALRDLAKDLKAWRADLLHLHTPWTPMLPWQVWRKMRLPTVATFHATLPDPPTDLLSRVLYRAAAHMAPRLQSVIVPSEVPRAQWARQKIAPLPRVLPPTIDLSAWVDAGSGRAAPRGPIRSAICVGRIEGRKGIDTALAAWTTVRRTLPEATLTIAGAGAPAEALPDGVVHLANPSGAKLRQAVANADLFIAPAGYGESYGLALVEAMAAGIPVLAADNPAYTALLGDLRTDMTFPVGDAGALAARVLSLSDMPEARGRIAIAGRQRAMLSDVATVGPQYLEVYRDALASNRDGTGNRRSSH